jgi:selT/selW/selH-like putative selenoprotein
LAATIQREFDVQPQLIEGSGGVFDVKVDGQLIFSKHDLGRFPQHDEIVTAIRGT